MGELWDVYDCNREKTGKIVERGKYLLKEDEYHLVVFAWIFDSDENLLITQRAPNKPFGLKWECTGGSVTKGENTLQGIKREVLEETGLDINLNKFKLIGTETENNCIVDVYLCRLDKIDLTKVYMQENETVDKKLVTLNEFENMIENDLVADNVKMCYEKYLKKHLKM